MTQQIFINLPVKDLEKTNGFFATLGYGFNAEFTDENAACMIISEAIAVMLLTEPFFATFIDKNISDAKKNTEVLLCLTCDSRAKVDTMISQAVAAGGK